jgi:hypothetical protein
MAVRASAASRNQLKTVRSGSTDGGPMADLDFEA